jgi:hypothetical protein
MPASLIELGSSTYCKCVEFVNELLIAIFYWDLSADVLHFSHFVQCDPEFSAEFSAMPKSKVIFTLLVFAVGIVAVPTKSAVAQYGNWQHRWPSHFARHPAQFRQASPWRRWGQGQHTSRRAIQSSHGCPTCYEAPYQPTSIGAYNPGNTSGMRLMNASSRPNGGYPSMNGGAYRNPGYSSQGASSSVQGAGSSPQGVGSSYQSAGSSSRNTDSTSTGGYQTPQAHYTCIVADMGYCGFNGRPNISSGSICHCGQASGFTR